jgi:hypothetical protein
MKKEEYEIPFNKYWRLGAELDERFSVKECVEIFRQERKELLESEIEDYESINNY